MIRIFLLCCLSGVLLADLPEYKPPFQAEPERRMPPELKVGTFLRDGRTCEQPGLMIGGKRIGLRRLYGQDRIDRDFIIGVQADGRDVFHIRFWGSLPGGNSGWPFRDLPGEGGRIAVDRGAGTITYRKPYRLSDGTTAHFSFTIRSGGDGCAEVIWDPGVSPERIAREKGFTLAPWLEFPFSTGYRMRKITIDGVDFVPQAPERFSGTGAKKTVRSFQGTVSTVEFDRFSPEKKITVRLPGKMGGSLYESYYESAAGEKQYQAVFQFRCDPAGGKRRIRIDFGAGSVKRNSPPPVAGIDFWKNDAIHIPQKPTRNLLSNPRFDQNLRYYRWISGGARYTPSEQPRYSIDAKNGRGGGKCLLIRPVQRKSAPIATFAIPMKKGQLYTMSCYAKSEKGGQLVFTPFSFSGTQFRHQYSSQHAEKTTHNLTGEWKRYSMSFRYDHGGVGLMLRAISDGCVWIDDLQLEEGSSATAFSAPPLDGLLRTADPDNLLNSGTPVHARFELFGGRGKVELALIDYYRKILWKQTFSGKGGDSIPLPFDKPEIGLGNFVVRAKFIPERGEPYYDYYRFSRMKFLRNKHATKNLFGTEMRSIGRISRADDLGRLFMVSGVGATVYGRINGPDNHILDKYGIENLLYMVQSHEGADPRFQEYRNYLKNDFRKLERAAPDALKKVEEMGYVCAKDAPEATRWALTGEIDKASAMLRSNRYDEYAKLLAAFHRGVRRANPRAEVFPDAGTQAYKKIWGRRETEEKIRATSGMIRWDAFATHPYGSLDGTAAGPDDFDSDVCAHFISMLKKYGYEKEPIYFVEAFNLIAAYVPEWGATWWGDNWQGGKTGYDWGLREYNQAAWIARGYLIALKYWPKVQHWDFWRNSPFFDLHLAPFAMLNAVNTLGNLFGNPKFYADIRPAAGIRAYVFRNEKGEGIAGVWYIGEKVEQGLIAAPSLTLKPGTEKLEFIDLMGNPRSYERKNGSVSLPLNAAPVFLRMKSPALLAEMLKQSEAVGGEVNADLKVVPGADGTLSAELLNLTGRTQSGTLKTGQGKKLAFSIPPNQSFPLPLKTGGKAEFGTMYRFSDDLSLSLKNGSRLDKHWTMHYFYVPRVSGTPDWKKIPAIPLSNRFCAKGISFRGEGDLKGVFRAAWSENALHLRVEVEDDVLQGDPKRFQLAGFDRDLYYFDGCLEVYFDCGANGIGSRIRGYDDDDYRYDFAPGNPRMESGPGLVHRRAAAHMQLAGGLDMPTAEEAAKKIRCQFTRTRNGYRYDLVFPQRYLEPFQLKPGAQAGFCLFLHDKDSLADKTGGKGVTITSEAGKPADHNPHLWPRMILK